jgi:hypothetical protein
MGKHSDPIITCECGMRYHSAHHVKHRASVWHHHSKRVSALLRNPCISQAEIARRLGITRQRVQQISVMIGNTPGRERQEVCTFTFLLEKWWKKYHAHPVIRKCLELDYVVEPVPRRHGYIARHCFINGHFARLAHLGKRRGYLTLRKPRDIADFHVAFSDVGIFIFPRPLMEGLSPGGTSFAPYRTKGAKIHNNHAYLACLEAWRPLAKPRRRHPHKRPA